VIDLTLRIMLESLFFCPRPRFAAAQCGGMAAKISGRESHLQAQRSMAKASVSERHALFADISTARTQPLRYDHCESFEAHVKHQLLP
jgi:hypothetical protein